MKHIPYRLTVWLGIVLLLFPLIFIHKSRVIESDELPEYYHLTPVAASDVRLESYNVLSTPQEAAAWARNAIRVILKETALLHGPYYVHEDKERGVFFVYADGFYYFHHGAYCTIRKCDGAILDFGHGK